MTGPFFADSNLIIYLHDSHAGAKQERAEEWFFFLWASRLGRVSYQALREFYHVSTRRLDPPLPRKIAQAQALHLMQWKPMRESEALFRHAWEIESRYQISWWDALIIGAALAMDCKIFLSEDLQHGQRFGDLIVQNPFLIAPPRTKAG